MTEDISVEAEPLVSDYVARIAADQLLILGWQERDRAMQWQVAQLREALEDAIATIDWLSVYDESGRIFETKLKARDALTPTTSPTTKTGISDAS